MKLANAIKTLPSLSYLELYNCFGDLKIFNLQEHFLMALKRRGRPIRSFKIASTFIGEGNFFSLIGLANRGYISESLSLDVAGIEPERPQR